MAAELNSRSAAWDESVLLQRRVQGGNVKASGRIDPGTISSSNMIYAEFDVVKTFQEGVPSDLRNVHAVCFVDSQDPEEGARLARYKIEQSGWEISRARCLPLKVSLRTSRTEIWGRRHTIGFA